MGYFDKLLCMENPRSIFDDEARNKSLTPGISSNAVRVSIKNVE